MAHGPQVSPPIEYASGVFNAHSAAAAVRAPVAPAASCPTVLLVGRSGSWGSAVLRSLAKFRSELCYTPPERVTAEYARRGGFSLILLDSTVPPAQRRQLVAELAGTDVSIFYTFPVEYGCWWLPALSHGQDCHGTPAFRRSEFLFELERILQEFGHT